MAMDIGCIECGEGSNCIGIFPTRAEAEAALVRPEAKQKANWMGEHRFDVFEAPWPQD